MIEGAKVHKRQLNIFIEIPIRNEIHDEIRKRINTRTGEWSKELNMGVFLSKLFIYCKTHNLLDEALR